MTGDITLAGFVVTAEEWDALEPGVRLALAASLDRPTATPTVATIAIALKATVPRADSANDAFDPLRALVEPVRDDYEAYELELLDSAA